MCFSVKCLENMMTNQNPRHPCKDYSSLHTLDARLLEYFGCLNLQQHQSLPVYGVHKERCLLVYSMNRLSFIVCTGHTHKTYVKEATGPQRAILSPYFTGLQTCNKHKVSCMQKPSDTSYNHEDIGGIYEQWQASEE